MGGRGLVKNKFSEGDRFGRNISNLGLIGCRNVRYVCVFEWGLSTFVNFFRGGWRVM